MKKTQTTKATASPPLLPARCYAALSDLTKDQRSLLLYLEARATDHGGLVDARHMNESDMTQAAKWTEIGLVSFGRIASESWPMLKEYRYWVTLSDEAWTLAHQERKARHERIYSRRQWLKTSELREAA